MEVVKKLRKISSAGDQINQITQPQNIETIKNGLKLSHSILGCIVPTNAKPKERIKSATTVIQMEDIKRDIEALSDESLKNELLALLRYEVIKVAASDSPRAFNLAKAVL